jgi:hypothetical protein
MSSPTQPQPAARARVTAAPPPPPAIQFMRDFNRVLKIQFGVSIGSLKLTPAAPAAEALRRRRREQRRLHENEAGVEGREALHLEPSPGESLSIIPASSLSVSQRALSVTRRSSYQPRVECGRPHEQQRRRRGRPQRQQRRHAQDVVAVLVAHPHQGQ